VVAVNELVCKGLERDGDASAEFTQQANAVAHEIFEVLLHGSWEAMLNYLPDSVVNKYADDLSPQKTEHGAGSSDVHPAQLEQILDSTNKEDLYVDACATRALAFNKPRDIKVLSSILLGPKAFVQRWHVKCHFGEEVILTTQLSLEERVEPKYRSIGIVEQWVLRKISGEPFVPDPLPSAPCPQWAPELVVMAQLEGLKFEDAERVYAFTSLRNRRATGPLGRFAHMLRSPQYISLLGHDQAEILNGAVMAGGKKYFTLVGILPESSPQRQMFLWVLVCEPSKPGQHCWRTESVEPVQLSMLRTWGRDEQGFV